VKGFAIGPPHFMVPCVHPLSQLAVTIAQQHLLIDVGVGSTGNALV
jgi:hypothetical protein